MVLLASLVAGIIVYRGRRKPEPQPARDPEAGAQPGKFLAPSHGGGGGGGGGKGALPPTLPEDKAFILTQLQPNYGSSVGGGVAVSAQVDSRSSGGAATLPDPLASWGSMGQQVSAPSVSSAGRTGKLVDLIKSWEMQWGDLEILRPSKCVFTVGPMVVVGRVLRWRGFHCIIIKTYSLRVPHKVCLPG